MIDDELLGIVREQNRDMRDISRELSLLAVQVGRHDEQFKLRPQIVAEGHERIEALAKRIEALEAVSWKPVVAIVTVVMGVFVIAMYLIAGGDPEGVKEMLP